MCSLTDTTFCELSNDLSASINVTKPELLLKSDNQSNTTSYTHISNNATNASNLPNLNISHDHNQIISHPEKTVNNDKNYIFAKEIQTDKESLGVLIAESYKKGDFSAIDTARNTNKNTCATSTKSSSIQTEVCSSRIFNSNKSEAEVDTK